MYETMDIVFALSSEIYEIKDEKLSKKAFFKTSFEKNHEDEFFGNFFRRKCSLGSCATFSENMMSVSVMDFEKSAKKKHRRDGKSRLGTSRNVQWSAEMLQFLCVPGPTTL